MWGKWSPRKPHYFIWHRSLVWLRKISICAGNKRNQNTLNKNHAVGSDEKRVHWWSERPQFWNQRDVYSKPGSHIYKCWDLTKFSPLNESLGLHWENRDERGRHRGLQKVLHVTAIAWRSADSKGSITCQLLCSLVCTAVKGVGLTRIRSVCGRQRLASQWEVRGRATLCVGLGGCHFW